MTAPTVMKFGGTGVEDAAALERLAAIAGAAHRDRPVVVVSAMARFTDALVRAVAEAAVAEAEGETEELLGMARGRRTRGSTRTPSR
jgi:aspartate kinase